MNFGQRQLEGIVPRREFTAPLTILTSLVMSFLIVFTLSLSIAAFKISVDWSRDLSKSLTLKISSTEDENQIDKQLSKAFEILRTSKGIASYRLLSIEDQKLLLKPWLGSDLPWKEIELPRIIDIKKKKGSFDLENFRLRLLADVPGAVLDDHSRWRVPVVRASKTLFTLGIFSIFLMVFASSAMIILAIRASMAANTQVITVLRLIGAEDSYISAVFVRRFFIRIFLGSLLGTTIGALVLFILPLKNVFIFSSLEFVGLEWFLLSVIPLCSALVGYISTRKSANHVLENLEL